VPWSVRGWQPPRGVNSKSQNRPKQEVNFGQVWGRPLASWGQRSKNKPFYTEFAPVGDYMALHYLSDNTWSKTLACVVLEKLLVVLRDGRTLIGFLRSIDQFGNVVITVIWLTALRCFWQAGHLACSNRLIWYMFDLILLRILQSVWKWKCTVIIGVTCWADYI